MTIAKLKCVCEVSSEDANLPAENLLHGKLWKTKSVGEKSAYVIFELEKPSLITSIDIENEHSAFVEVLVSNNLKTDNSFSEILITCSFMTPSEGKTSSNPNRLRCFSKEALVPTIASQKWQFIKIICTQPFNKNVQYGISFIKIHVIENQTSDETTKPLVPEKFLVQNQKKIGSFALREDSPDSESESSATLFNRWKMSRNINGKEQTAAASIRQASTSAGRAQTAQNARKSLPVASNSSASTSSQLRKDTPVLDRNRDDLTFGTEESDELDNEKLKILSKHIDADNQRLKKESESNTPKNSEKVKKPKTPKPNTSKSEEKTRTDTSKRDKTPDNKSRKRPNSPDMRSSKKRKSVPLKEYRPFNQLLRGVVLVISGIQNPDRANLRSQALAMGAKYKTDWDDTCTHLICAFKNTPKYNQVKGHGKIIGRSWIEKCFSLKKYLPWRRYALDGDEQEKPESDTEILDVSFKETTENISSSEETLEPVKVNIARVSSPRKERKSVENVAKNSPPSVNSGSDTDDYIAEINQKNEVKKLSPTTKIHDIFDLTTEEEDFVEKKTKKSIVPVFFDKLNFLISDELGKTTKNRLSECVRHYGGKVTTKPQEADYFIADSLKSDDTSITAEVVKPQWVLECNDMEQKVSTKPYLIKTN